jgi:hypothetical protein
LEQRTQPIDVIARTPVAAPAPVNPVPVNPAPTPPAAPAAQSASAAPQASSAPAATAVAEADPGPEPEPAPEQEFDPIAEADAEPEVFVDEPVSADVAAAGAPSLEEVIVSWPTAIATLNEASPRLGAALENARPERIEDHRLVLAFAQSSSFLRNSAEKPASRETIAKHIADATGFLFAIDTELLPDDQFAHIAAAVAAGEPGVGIDKDELIERLKKEFDATEMAEVPPE